MVIVSPLISNDAILLAVVAQIPTSQSSVAVQEYVLELEEPAPPTSLVYVSPDLLYIAAQRAPAAP